MKQWRWITVFGLVVLMASPSGWAADPGIEAEIEMLKERLVALEAKLAAQEVVAAGAPEGVAVVQLPSGLQGIELSGFVDTAYTYNFAEPEDMANDGRIFDVAHNSFVVNNAQLNISKGVDAVSPLGFKVALMFGDDAEVTKSTGFFAGDGTESLDIQQAYVEYLAPVGEGLDLTFGKQATLIGAEVIESIDNWNYSRSYMFGLAIPFTHAGIRASYPLSETLTFTTGVNNGWSIADDVNIGKGIEGQLAWEDGPYFVSATGMYSPRLNAGINDNADRWIADLVVTYQATDNLALMLNYDFGWDEDVAAIGKDATWQGIATYAKYDINDRWSLAGRYEFFRDHDGSKLPTLSGTVGDVSFQELTLTSEHKLDEHLIARLEYRHDMANSNVFGHDDAGLQNYQDTMAVEFIMPF